MHQSQFYLTLSYHCLCYVKCLCNPTQNKDVELAGKRAQWKGLFYTRSGQGSNHWWLESTRDSMRKDHAAEGKHINPSFSNSSTLALFWQMCHLLHMTSTSSVSQDLTNSLPDGDALWQGWATRVLREQRGYRGTNAVPKQGHAPPVLPARCEREVQATAQALVPFPAQSRNALVR